MNIAGVFCLTFLVFSLDAVSAMESKNTPDAFRSRTAVYWREDGTALVFDISAPICDEDDERENIPITSIVIDHNHQNILNDLIAERGKLPDSLLNFLEENHFWDAARRRQGGAGKNNNNQENH